MPAEIPQDIMQEMNNQMISVSNRIRLIQQRANDMDKEIDKRNINWKKNIEQFNYEISLMSKELSNLKKEFKVYLRDIMKIINEFRASAKKSSFDEFKKDVDALQFENLITHAQFKRLMED